MPKVNHPMQPVVKGKDKVLRFKVNNIVRHLLDHGPWDLNLLHTMSFSREDWTQFNQLIGYSLSGFCELSHVSNKAKDEAWEILTAGESGSKKKAK